MSRLVDIDEVKKCLEEVSGDDKADAIALLEWAIDKRTVQAVPIEKIQTLINNIEVMRTSPALIDNDDVQRFAENVLYALNNLIKEGK